MDSEIKISKSLPKPKPKRELRDCSQPLRVESTDFAYIITSKCVRQELWFVNNPELSERIKAFLAKYCEEMGVILYEFELVGNHYHLLARFTDLNCAAFFRNLNARIAEAVKKFCPDFIGGQVFERRYSISALPEDEDVEYYFFYIALQVVSAGLCARLSEYPDKTHFSDAVKGIERKHRYFSYREYNKAQSRNPKVSRANYWREYKLKFARLPGYEHLSQEDYSKLMHEKLEIKRQEIVAEFEGRFRTKAELKKVRPGSRPKNSKTGTRRPVVLSRNPEAKKRYLDFYMSKVSDFFDASFRFRSGEFSVEFPPEMYRPPGNTIFG